MREEKAAVKGNLRRNFGHEIDLNAINCEFWGIFDDCLHISGLIMKS